MADPSIFCAKVRLPWVDECMAMSEWGVIWQAIAVLVAAVAAIGSIWKVSREIKKLRLQREEDAALKRTEFFLAQHRRLFDDTDLASVLALLDGDETLLADFSFWERKRKFLTFIEEIEWLIRSGKINSTSAYYMFGYYAICARDGLMFNVGIDTAAVHWALFNSFCRDAQIFLAKHPSGPPADAKL